MLLLNHSADGWHQCYVASLASTVLLPAEYFQQLELTGTDTTALEYCQELPQYRRYLEGLASPSIASMPSSSNRFTLPIDLLAAAAEQPHQLPHFERCPAGELDASRSIIHGFASPSLCSALYRAFEPSIRPSSNNSRTTIMFESQELAVYWEARLRSILEIRELDPARHRDSLPPASAYEVAVQSSVGTQWRFHSIAPSMRAVFYTATHSESTSPQPALAPHVDSEWRAPANTGVASDIKSFISLIVYLTSVTDGHGGGTRFIADGLTIQPTIGTAVLFLHSLEHCGEPLVVGELPSVPPSPSSSLVALDGTEQRSVVVKALIRCDVLFRRW